MRGSEAGTIVRTQLHDELVRQLRAMIMHGSLEPGTRVQERTLCERFGVSRTPLREALKVLASSGLVELWPNRGAWVAPLRAEDVREAFEILAMIEAGAAEAVAPRLDDATLAELHRLQETMVLYLRLGERENGVRLDLQMHRTLAEATGNRLLATTHAELALKVERARYLASLSDERMRVSVQEHEAILVAADARDPRALALALRHHCAMTSAAVVAAVESRLANATPAGRA